MSREKINLFSDGAMNALYQAILDCADDEVMGNGGKEEDFKVENYHMYKFLEDCPRSSMVCFVVDKLRENGFDIQRKGDCHEKS